MFNFNSKEKYFENPSSNFSYMHLNLKLNQKLLSSSKIAIFSIKILNYLSGEKIS